MGMQLSNLAASTLAAGITTVATSLAVAAGAGASFPTLGTNDYFYATLANSSGTEIVKVTARASDTFTIVRAQEGTTAKAFNAGDACELRLTAQTIKEYVANPSQNLVPSGAYALVLTDDGKTLVSANGNAAATWTIPANGSVPFLPGTTIQLRVRETSGIITLAITTDTLRMAGTNATGPRTLNPGAFATLYKDDATNWTVSGAGVA